MSCWRSDVVVVVVVVGIVVLIVENTDEANGNCIKPSLPTTYFSDECNCGAPGLLITT